MKRGAWWTFRIGMLIHIYNSRLHAYLIQIDRRFFEKKFNAYRNTQEWAVETPRNSSRWQTDA